MVDSKNAESCVERIPSGKDRPHFTEKIARRALSGHALTLEVVVEHGKGETVLPTGFRLLSDSPEAKALEREGFALPDPEGAAGPKLERTEQGERATTKVRLSVVPLPPKPGRHELVLPPLPIAVSRASGELVDGVHRAAHGPGRRSDRQYAESRRRAAIPRRGVSSRSGPRPSTWRSRC